MIGGDGEDEHHHEQERGTMAAEIRFLTSMIVMGEQEQQEQQEQLSGTG